MGLRQEMCPVAPEALISMICEMVDPSLHDKILDRFINAYIFHLPAIVFPPNITAREVLETKPMLFLVILASIGPDVLSPTVATKLLDLSLELLKEACFGQNIKSLEMVQAVLILVLFYKP